MSEQTPAERDAILDMAKDGHIYCFNLREATGIKGAETLSEFSKDVKDGVHSAREFDLPYLFVLIPARGGGRAMIAMADDTALEDAAAKIHTRSRDFGETFAVMVVPYAQNIVDIFASLQAGEQSAI